MIYDILDIKSSIFDDPAFRIRNADNQVAALRQKSGHPLPGIAESLDNNSRGRRDVSGGANRLKRIHTALRRGFVPAF
jgi:hypothetical protein